MEKLTIQHIAPYLPYGLEGSFQDEEDGTQYYTAKLEIDNVEWFLEETSGIHLFHISCLTKTIQHEGREFCPIVELAKIAFPNYDWVITGQQGKAWSKEVEMYFKYCDANKSFIAANSPKNWEFEPVFFQYDLFQKLAEWHINFLGIPEHLIIDKETLK